MRDYHAEEIIFSLAFLISMLAFEFNRPLIGWAFAIKAAMDFICIFIAIKTKAKNDINRKYPKI